MNLEQQIENDLDIAFEQCLSIGTTNALETMRKMLEQVKPTYKNYQEYFNKWEEKQHQRKLGFELPSYELKREN